jgi:hypothetical protein
MNADSAVPAGAMSEEQTFRNEVNGSLPLTDIDHRRLKMKIRLTMVKWEIAKRTLKLYSWVPSILQVCSSLNRPEGLTAESGMKKTLRKKSRTSMAGIEVSMILSRNRCRT